MCPGPEDTSGTPPPRHINTRAFHDRNGTNKRAPLTLGEQHRLLRPRVQLHAVLVDPAGELLADVLGLDHGDADARADEDRCVRDALKHPPRDGLHVVYVVLVTGPGIDVRRHAREQHLEAPAVTRKVLQKVEQFRVCQLVARGEVLGQVAGRAVADVRLDVGVDREVLDGECGDVGADGLEPDAPHVVERERREVRRRDVHERCHTTAETEPGLDPDQIVKLALALVGRAEAAVGDAVGKHGVALVDDHDGVARVNLVDVVVDALQVGVQRNDDGDGATLQEGVAALGEEDVRLGLAAQVRCGDAKCPEDAVHLADDLGDVVDGLLDDDDDRALLAGDDVGDARASLDERLHRLFRRVHDKAPGLGRDGRELSQRDVEDVAQHHACATGVHDRALLGGLEWVDRLLHRDGVALGVRGCRIVRGGHIGDRPRRVCFSKGDWARA